MNIVKMSIEMKKPNTPVERSANHRKKFLGSGLIFHEAKTPANTMIAESIIIRTEIPSTPTASWIFSGAYHIQLPVKSISAVSPAARRSRNHTQSQIARPSNAVEHTVITVRMAFILLLRQMPNPAIMTMGMITNQIKIFPNIIYEFFCN